MPCCRRPIRTAPSGRILRAESDHQRNGGRQRERAGGFDEARHDFPLGCCRSAVDLQRQYQAAVDQSPGDRVARRADRGPTGRVSSRSTNITPADLVGRVPARGHSDTDRDDLGLALSPAAWSPAVAISSSSPRRTRIAPCRLSRSGPGSPPCWPPPPRSSHTARAARSW